MRGADAPGPAREDLVRLAGAALRYVAAPDAAIDAHYTSEEYKTAVLHVRGHSTCSGHDFCTYAVMTSSD